MIDKPPPIPCPFVYATGRACEGHIVRMEAYKAEAVWEQGEDGRWGFDIASPMRYHLFCSQKGNHAGFDRPAPPSMKYWAKELPEELQKMLIATGIRTALDEGALF